MLLWGRRRTGLLLQLLSFLLLFFLRQVVPDHTTGRGTDHAVMPGKMSCNTADDGSLDTTLRVDSRRSDQEHHTNQWRGNDVQFHSNSPLREL